MISQSCNYTIFQIWIRSVLERSGFWNGTKFWVYFSQICIIAGKITLDGYRWSALQRNRPITKYEYFPPNSNNSLCVHVFKKPVCRHCSYGFYRKIVSNIGLCKEKGENRPTRSDRTPKHTYTNADIRSIYAVLFSHIYDPSTKINQIKLLFQPKYLCG